MVLRALQIAAAVCTFSSLAYGQTPATIARGRELAERVCAGCHAINGGAGGGPIPGTSAPSFRAIAGRPNQPPQRLQSFIMTPHRPMPGIPLSLAEVDDIVAYLLTLK